MDRGERERDGTGLPPLLVGGPDAPPRALRDRLQALVDASPPGSSIDWATYYFRDRALAESLIRAADRGVAVRLVLAASTRLLGANDRVVVRLAAHGLAGGLRLRDGPGHLHAKVYAFSAPQVALVGSFNPSGDDPEDAAVIAAIGDQDRGWNLLLPLADPRLCAALRAYVHRLGDARASLLDRLRPAANRVVASGDTALFLYPRLRTVLVEADVATARQGDAVTAAISHLKPGRLVDALARAARRGARVEALLHATERRVPSRVVARLADAGVATTRVGDGAALPMHGKFVMVRTARGARAWLGSYNYNPRSRFLNDELLVRTADPVVLAALDALAARICGSAAAA